jgi:hypothetical protein
MKRIFFWLALFTILGTRPSYASDHADGTTAGPALALDPTADINDVFTWMSSDASQVNLVMSVFPGATATSRFSDAVKYVFHTSSMTAYLGTAVARDIICTFTNATPQLASCWVTDPADASANGIKGFVSGDASGNSGAASGNGQVRVFAGLREDPFFFNLAGFHNATSTVAAAIKDASGSASFQGTYIKGLDSTHPGCPILTATARNVVTGYLGHDCTGVGSPVDFFKKSVDSDNAGCTVKPALVNTQQTKNAGLTGNIMAIVVQVSRSLLTTGGPILNVWAATTK